MKKVYFLSLMSACTISLASCLPSRGPEEKREIKKVNNIEGMLGKINSLSDLITKAHPAEDTLNNMLGYKHVVVDFYASWCGPCMRLTPVFESLAQKYTDVLFIKVDVDKFDTISSQYGIRSIPAIIYFKAGQKIDQTVGYNPTEIEQKIANLYS